MVQRKHVKKLILVLIYSFFNLHDSKKAKEKALLNLPEIPLDELNENQLDGIKRLVVMDMECTYCAYQMEDLKLVSKALKSKNCRNLGAAPSTY
ncbi:hypothetical protein G3567_02375 [Psychroflexus sp. YR1-1]|uniref:Uncharacterized protein n=1 Tax=Psychroflexus aurantiacus TaxID=2709310 RepID=A0A6B3QYW7_9FLAO|nr:hypothetical protein [Psychroflexus aurantiacus]NEV92992.1 hypothetical protein [Psychroflexus aurantiacus]